MIDGATHLLEREYELVALNRAWEAASAGGQIAIVCGEAGIGKTALVQEFISRAAGAGRRLVGQCENLSAPEPLGPLRDVSDALGGPVSDLLRSGAPRLDLFTAVLKALETQARPSLLVFEDVHWADAATLDLVRFLGRRLARVRALIVLTYRDDEVDRRHPLWSVLGSFSARSTLRLPLAHLSESAVAKLAGVKGEDFFLLSRGNPFFVTELIAGAGAAMPPTVREAVLARASSLPEAARDLLDFCAILPGRAPLALIEAALRPPVAALEACLRTGLLVAEQHAVRFRHELARLAVESALPPVTAAALHALVLSIAGQNGAPDLPLAQRLHHAVQAGATETVLELAPRAATEAAAAGAHREAAAHLARALLQTALLTPADRAELTERHAYESYLTGEMEAAVADRLKALAWRRQTGDAPRVSENLRWLSRLYWFLGRKRDAMVKAEEAIVALHDDIPSAELGWAVSNLAQLLMLDNRNEAAVAEGSRALVLAEALKMEELRIHALNNVGTARLLLEDSQGRLDLEESLRAAKANDMHEHVCRAYTNLSSCAVTERDYARAEPYFAAGLAYSTERDLDSWTDYMRGYLARLHLETGRWTEAADLATQVLSTSSVPINRLFPLCVMGLIRLRRGDPGGSALLSEANEIAEANGSIMRVGATRAALAEQAWLDGDMERARAAAEPALRLAVDRGDRAQAVVLAFWLHLAGKEVAVDAPAWPLGLRRVGIATEAERAWRDLGCPYEAALALQATGTAGRIAALAQLDGLGASRVADILRRRLRDDGVQRVPRGARATTRRNSMGLTSREAEVLELMANGLSNREMADRLIISVRTVDHHVSAVLAKLQVPDRQSAARIASRFPFSPQNGWRQNTK